MHEELVLGEGFGRFKVGGGAGGVENLLRADFEGGFELESTSVYMLLVHFQIAGCVRWG